MGSFDLARWLIVLCTLLSACAAHQEGSTKTGILQGKVTIGPLKPGPVRQGDDDSAAAAKLYASHKIAILSPDAEMTIATAPIDPSGNYRIELQAGKYLIDFVPHDIGMRRLPPSPILIESGKTTTFDFDIDTGMR